MIIKTSKTSILIKKFNDDKKNVPYFFLHGFTGSYKSWLEVINRFNKSSYAMDIPGHGKSHFLNLNENYTISDWISEFYMILNHLNIEKINLCAYSMGGRLAIAFAKKYPNKINSLILESTNIGIQDDEERLSRYDNDIKLATLIKSNYPEFIDKWQENNLFTQQKQRNASEWENQILIRKNHNNEQLAKSLIIFSVGAMKYYEDDFKLFDFPILIINGSEDDKYIKYGKDMTIMNTNAKQYIISESNHNTHMESPELFIDILEGGVYE